MALPPANNKCQRCGKEGDAVTMSMFNTDWCCPGCIEIEKAHPDYQKARDVELEQLQQKNYNFPGIGLPADLKPRGGEPV